LNSRDTLKKNIDIISVGEVLIDFIGDTVNATVATTENYHRLVGGSATNVAINAAKLGLKAALVATTGNDGLGTFIETTLKNHALDLTWSRKSSALPTSVILVSRSTGTPDFIAYREADCEIHESQLPDELLLQSRIFHTTCFALSKQPAQATILSKAARARSLGLQLSIDINFSDNIWPDREAAWHVLRKYIANDPLIKLSEDDCLRLFGTVLSESDIFQHFHQLGATVICLTKGKNGVTLSDKANGVVTQPALPITTVLDATGAGDAFWTGFLFARLNNMSAAQSLTIAQSMARLKLQNIGPIPGKVNLRALTNNLL
jgi:fructokinase